MDVISSSPPRAPPVQYTAPLGTRWAKEKAAAGGSAAFDLPTDPKCIGPWIIGECVGKGASGRVKIAKHKHTGQLAAVKILPLAPLMNSRASLATQQAKSEKQRLGIDREITMMKLMNHPNILRIYDVYEGSKELFLVLEYVEGGELFDFLVNRGRLPPAEALAYFKQLVYGLNYAHTFSIIHRDLKPENILIASLSPPLIKIADWGMAAFAPPSLQLETSCGSPHYASPEIVNGERYQGNATDIWSCGVILYALLTGRLPFDDKNIKTLLAKVKSGKFDMPAWLHPPARDLLSRMLVVDSSKRITIPEILCHPWMLSTANPQASPIALEGQVVDTPPLPPSPSTLARPIADPTLIDPDLLCSLRIIWGRHADSAGEAIKRDLCSPAGQGVHAKAFYFLLGRYRDETSRFSEVDSNENGGEPPAAIGNLNFNLGWELDLKIGPAVTQKYDGRRAITGPTTRSAALAPSTAPVPVPVSGLTPPIMIRNATTATASRERERPPSPAGPRQPTTSSTGANKSKPEKTKLRPPSQYNNAPNSDIDRRRSSANLDRPRSSIGVIGHSEPSGRPPPHVRGNTYSHRRPSLDEQKPARDMDGGASNLRFPSQGHGRRPSTSRRSSSHRSRRPTSALEIAAPSKASVAEGRDSPTTIYAPVPVSATALAQVASPIMDIAPQGTLQLVTAPKTTNAQLQKAMDEMAERVNEMVVAETAVGARETRQRAVLGAGQENRLVSPKAGNDDKENRSMGEDDWSYVGTDEGRSGLGLSVGRDVGRDMGNVTFAPEKPNVKGKKDKEKKSRPPPLEFPSLNRKRSTLSVLGSPTALSPPLNGIHNANNPQSSRLLTSPVVGEFKGWFSNLFGWRSQTHGPHHTVGSGVLYSSDDARKTRREVGRFFQCLGVIVEGPGFTFQEGSGSGSGAEDNVLRCKVEESNQLAVMQLNARTVRFRVEFTPAPVQNSSNSPTSPNYDSYFLAAPGQQAAMNPRGRGSMLIGKSPHTTPLPSPNPNSNSGAGFPPGCLSAIVMVHEKGSMSTFKAVWKKLKDMYADPSAPYPCLSPAIGATPLVEHPQRFAI